MSAEETRTRAINGLQFYATEPDSTANLDPTNEYGRVHGVQEHLTKLYESLGLTPDQIELIYNAHRIFHETKLAEESPLARIALTVLRADKKIQGSNWYKTKLIPWMEKASSMLESALRTSIDDEG